MLRGAASCCRAAAQLLQAATANGKLKINREGGAAAPAAATVFVFLIVFVFVFVSFFLLVFAKAQLYTFFIN